MDRLNALIRRPTLRSRRRDWAAVAIAGASLAIGIGVLAGASFSIEARLVQGTDGRVVVDDVDATSRAWQNGLRPGMIVLSVNGVQLVTLPQYIYPETPPTPDPETGEEPPFVPSGIEPTVPLDSPIDQSALVALLAAPVTDLAAIQPWDLERGHPEAWATVDLYDDWYSASLQGTTPAVLIGTLVLVLFAWWLASGRAGPTLRPFAIPLAVATAVPFLVRPLDQTLDPTLVSLASVLVILAMLPLASVLIERVAAPDERRTVGLVSATCAVVGLAVAAIHLVPGSWQSLDFGVIGWVVVGAIPFVPGLAAAGPVRSDAPLGRAISSGRLLESTEYAVIGATPFFALATDGVPYVFPLALWLVFLFMAGQFTVRPLARLASRATLQRDIVVAATEAERARVAADIHDDALQELTLLVHRLDGAGDAEGADIARGVSDRLRAICGDLRLPILDDLGVGPALDWLVLRIERLAGGEVRLERSDEARPPSEVELAFFRIAQEAMSNAVKHGRPPIVVRYSTSPTGASLSIDDAGAGIEPDAGESAEQTGHYGLLNMQQRAEAIGAILDVRRWPAGGTHVKLDWRAP